MAKAKPAPKDTGIFFRIDNDLLRRLDRVAKRENRSRSGQIREAILECAERNEPVRRGDLE